MNTIDDAIQQLELLIGETEIDAVVYCTDTQDKLTISVADDVGPRVAAHIHTRLVEMERRIDDKRRRKAADMEQAPQSGRISVG